MNNQKDVNNVTNQGEQYVDPRTVQAEVLGELRKEKIGKPGVVLYMFVFFICALISLPYINDMLNDEESFLYKMINGEVTDIGKQPVTQPKAEFMDASQEQPLVKSTVMKYENIVMKNFELSKGKVKCIMYSYNGLINLDEEEYYLEIYSNNKNFVNYIKLTGSYDYVEKNVVFTSETLNFNDSLNYFGKVVLMDETKYPDVTLTSDESGLSSFLCKKGGRSIEYTFKNNYLVNIKDSERVKVADYGNETQLYINALSKYRTKASKLPEMALVEEVTDGFQYTANINLEKPDFVLPYDIGDYEYYRLDTQAKIVHYSMIGKGYDCE